jgi:hypothetical protein
MGQNFRWFPSWSWTRAAMSAAFISCNGVSKLGALSPRQQTLKKAGVQKRHCTMAAPPLSPSEGMSGGTEKSTYFFAVDTPSSSAEQLRNQLHEIDEEHLKRNGRRLQGAWEPTSNYHQTLLYLGKPLTIPAWKVAKATDVLAPYEPFPMRLTGIYVFPFLLQLPSTRLLAVSDVVP